MSQSSLHERLRKMQQRLAVRAWEYRQRHTSKGVWFRLRCVLGEAAEAYAVCSEDAERLLEGGARRQAVGDEIHPAKSLLFVSHDQLESVRDRTRIPVRLGAEFLAAQAVLLVPFD